jgi:hypothetical protein
MSQPETVLKKPEQPAQEKSEKEPTPFTITVSAVKPESAIVAGGLWVLTIPLNQMPRFAIIGFAYDSFHRLLTLLDEMDAARDKRRKSLVAGVTDVVTKGLAKAGIIRPS